MHFTTTLLNLLYLPTLKETSEYDETGSESIVPTLDLTQNPEYMMADDNGQYVDPVASERLIYATNTNNEHEPLEQNQMATNYNQDAYMNQEQPGMIEIVNNPANSSSRSIMHEHPYMDEPEQLVALEQQAKEIEQPLPMNQALLLTHKDGKHVPIPSEYSSQVDENHVAQHGR